MADIVSELFWGTLQSSPWIRRAFFGAIIVVPPFFGWFSWTVIGIAAASWAAYEIADLIRFALSRRT